MTTEENLMHLLIKQLSSFFDISETEVIKVRETFDAVLTRMEKNLCSPVNGYLIDKNRSMDGRGGVKFNHLYSTQYMTFLYYYSNTIYKTYHDSALASKLYYLNKIMNGVDLFYEIELPERFGAEHPVGSVMGRATYGNEFFFFQGCTVGVTYNADGTKNYPIIGDNVRMYTQSCILGKCIVGNNVNIGAGTIIKNQDVPDNCSVFGQSPHLIFKKKI